VSSFQQAGTLMALSELNLQYRAPLRAGDIFYVSTAVAQVWLEGRLLEPKSKGCIGWYVCGTCMQACLEHSSCIHAVS
jgi:hypothetical protein